MRRLAIDRCGVRAAFLSSAPHPEKKEWISHARAAAHSAGPTRLPRLTTNSPLKPPFKTAVSNTKPAGLIRLPSARILDIEPRDCLLALATEKSTVVGRW
jgi:hypothetical protein